MATTYPGTIDSRTVNWSSNRSLHQKLEDTIDGVLALETRAGTTGTVVTSVTAGDTSIVVAGTATAPTIKTATLDVIAADHPAAADWSNNSHKITSLANGSAAQDAAAFGQVPTTGQIIGDIFSEVNGGATTTETLKVGVVNAVAYTTGGLAVVYNAGYANASDYVGISPRSNFTEWSITALPKTGFTVKCSGATGVEVVNGTNVTFTWLAAGH